MSDKILNLVQTPVHIDHPYGYVDGILEKHGDTFKIFIWNEDACKALISFVIEDVKYIINNNISLS